MTKAQMGIENSVMAIPLFQIHITFVVRHWQLKSEFASSSKIA
jgi:hypothetical protein